MVKFALKRFYTKGAISFELPQNDACREAIKRELIKCRDKYNDYVLVTLEPPKRPRTTGKDSQNHHLNGHIMQICNETGESYEVVKYCIKMIAVEQMGYSYKTIAGHIVPQPESESSTVECAMLIEAAHILAAQLSITLQE